MLICYHFAKTGGTAILAHLTAHLGEAVFNYGPWSNLKRIEMGEPLLEELPKAELDKIQAVLGHGVTAGVAGVFADRKPTTFAVLREPGARFVSAYKHVQKHALNPPASAREDLMGRPPSPFTKEVVARFGGPENLGHILRNEHLAEDSAPLFAAIGVPPLDIQRRVSTETADLGDLTLDEVRARDHLDVELYARLPLTGTSVTAEPWTVEQAYRRALSHGANNKRALSLRYCIERVGTPRAREFLHLLPEADPNDPAEQKNLEQAKRRLR